MTNSFISVLMDWDEAGASVDYKTTGTETMGCPRCSAPVKPNTEHRCGNQVTPEWLYGTVRINKIIPRGWKFLAFRAPKNGEAFLAVNAHTVVWAGSDGPDARIILVEARRKKARKVGGDK